MERKVLNVDKDDLLICSLIFFTTGIRGILSLLMASL
jgi:hypothetical protein